MSRRSPTNIWLDETYKQRYEDEYSKRRFRLKDPSYYYWRTEVVDSLVECGPNEYLLDLGCANGARLERFEDSCLTVGIDVNREYCLSAKKNAPRSDIILASMEYLPFKPETIRTAVSVYSMVYAPDKEKVFQDVSRVLVPGGNLILFEPNNWSIKALLHFLVILKLCLTGDYQNPRLIHHKIVLKQAIGYFKFRDLGLRSEMSVNYWNSYTHNYIENFHLPKRLNGDLVSKKWHHRNYFKFFGDFLIIKLLKS